LGEGVRGFKEGMHGASQASTPPPPAQTPAPAEKPSEEKKS
jgi:hypothetical protein